MLRNSLCLLVLTRCFYAVRPQSYDGGSLRIKVCSVVFALIQLDERRGQQPQPGLGEFCDENHNINTIIRQVKTENKSLTIGNDC